MGSEPKSGEAAWGCQYRPCGAPALQTAPKRSEERDLGPRYMPIYRWRGLGASGPPDVRLANGGALPGFGFGKTLQENHQLLRQLEHLHVLGCPLLIGVSRKSMITKKLNVSTEDALNGTSILNTVAYVKGAAVFRVHDAAATQELITLLEKE